MSAPPPGPHPARRAPGAWALVALAVLLGAGLRAAGLETRSLWGDEIASLAFATGHEWMPREPALVHDTEHYRRAVRLEPGYFAQRLVAVARTDTQAPLYYLLLTFWAHLFGTSEAALRALSLVASVATVPVLFLLGRRLASPDVGVLAAFAFALAPFQVAFGQYNRPYALLALLAAGATWALVRLVEAPRRRWAAGYAALGALGLYTHYFFVWTLVGHALIVLAVARRRPGVLARWLLAQVGIGLALAPWAPSILAQVRWVREADVPTWFYWHAGALGLPEAVLLAGRNLVLLLAPGRVRGLCGPVPTCVADQVATWALYLGAAALLGLAAAALVRRLRAGPPTPEPDTWTVAVPWAGAILAGPLAVDLALGSHAGAVHRYAVAAGGPVALAVAAGLVAIGPRRARGLAIAAAGVVLLAGSVLHLSGLAHTLLPPQEVRAAARYLDAAGADGELIVVLDPLPHPLDFAYYLRTNPRFARIRLPGRGATADIPAQLEQVTRGRAQLWLVDDHGPEVEARAAVRAWLRAHYREAEVHAVPGLTVVRFAR